jgi:Fe-S cluster assembly ATP-binding protein
MLKLNNLCVNAGETAILQSITYTFEKNKVYVLMGPNGSGKSTVANTLMGNPVYTITSGTIKLNDVELNELEANERADLGLFLSFQNPVALQGIKPYELLRAATNNKLNPLEVRKHAKALAQELHIPESLLSRSLNDGASGGERKKLEVLQAYVLQKEIIIFDEVDTGVDVDALKTIGEFLQNHKTGKTYIIITHYNRILEYINPDVVLIMHGGRIVKEGGADLVKQVEKDGYKNLT